MLSADNSRIAWLNDVTQEEMRRIIDALYRAHRFVGNITDLDTLLRSIMEEGKLVAEAEACSLMLYSEESDELYFRVALGETGDQEALQREIRLKLGQGIAGIVAETRAHINVLDAQSDTRLHREADAASNFETRTLLAIPLLDKEELVGVLEVVNKVDGRPFSETDIHVLHMFGALVAGVIRNAQLIEENLRAERLAAIGQAIAGLSHYTKNVVTGMISGRDLISQALEEENLDILRKSWPIFNRSTERVANFVEDMLQYSKAREPFYEPCDIRDIVKDVLETFQGLITRKQIMIHLLLDDITAPVLADGRGLFRCILNIVLNAADAVGNEGGQIWVSASLDDSQLVIEISDNGPGVPEEIRLKIYDPFFSTKGSGGTGLGMAVTRKIVDEHGGVIEVEDAEQGGALFRIRIPQNARPQKETLPYA